MPSTQVLVLQFIQLVCLAVIMESAWANEIGYLAKMALKLLEYMVTQRNYAGWAWFGIPIFDRVGLLLQHACVVRKQRIPFILSVAALALTMVTLQH